jgi:hypothetical protein
VAMGPNVHSFGPMSVAVGDTPAGLLTGHRCSAT